MSLLCYSRARERMRRARQRQRQPARSAAPSLVTLPKPLTDRIAQSIVESEVGSLLQGVAHRGWSGLLQPRQPPPPPPSQPAPACTPRAPSAVAAV